MRWVLEENQEKETQDEQGKVTGNVKKGSFSSLYVYSKNSKTTVEIDVQPFEPPKPGPTHPRRATP